MKNIGIIALIISILLFVFVVIIYNSQSDNLAGIPISGNLSLGVNSTITATTTAKLVLAAKYDRQFLSISNVGVYDAWISATTTNLAANYGLWIKASTTQIFSGDSLYTGAIYGIGTGTTTLSFLEI